MFSSISDSLRTVPKAATTAEPSAADPKAATATEPKAGTTAEPNAATATGPKAATAAEPNVDTAAAPKAATTAEKIATAAEPKAATAAAPKAVTTPEPKIATAAKPKAATTTEPNVATKAEPNAEPKGSRVAEVDPKGLTSKVTPVASTAGDGAKVASGPVSVPKPAPKKAQTPDETPGAAKISGGFATGAPPTQQTQQPSKLIANGVDPKAPPTAMERVAAFGTTLFRGPQAVADPPKAKPQAKSKANAGGSIMPSTLPKAASTVAPTPGTTITKLSNGPGIAAGNVFASPRIVETVSMKPSIPTVGPYKGPSGPIDAMPPSGISQNGDSCKRDDLANVVTGYAAQSPQSTTAAKPPASSATTSHRTGSPQVGAARAYAAMAAPLLEKLDPKGDIPREGPATVAVGRGMATGRPAVVKDGKLPKAPIAKKYQIVLVSAELAPYSKTGGLGEALDGLSVALAALGHRVMVISPRYDQYEDAWDTSFWSSVTMGGKTEPVHFFHAYKQKVDQVFVDHPSFSEAVDGKTGSKLYGPQFGEDYVDNQARFAYFCKCALIAIRSLPLGGFPYGEDVVIVANDWHSGLVPMFIEAERRLSSGNWRPERTKVITLTHNAVYQGRFELEEGLAEIFGIPQSFIDEITFKMPIQIGEFNPKVKCVNHLAAGLLYCDLAVTVSPTYALEISTVPEYGVELERLFLAKRCTGILNGIKEGVSAADEKFLTNASIVCAPFTVDTVDVAKAEMKNAYLESRGLTASEGPLACFVGRLDVQKGYDLLLAALEEVLLDTEMQVVIIGAGRTDLTTQTKALVKQFPSKVYFEGWMGPERYGVIGACDYTLFPSRWEPCGLVQMECMRLGTCPVVAPTGGLKDSVEDDISGFWTDTLMTNDNDLCEESVASIARVLRRMANSYISSPRKVTDMRQAAMAASAEFTWSNAALQYESVFEQLGVVDVLPHCVEEEVTLQADKLVS